MAGFTTRPEITGSFGAVSSTHWLASAAGFGVLERGGNAFDAAVATAFTLQVVEPHLNGPAGETPILLHDATSGRTVAVCGQGPAPQAATIARYRDLGLDLVPGTGFLAACVPGSFDAWMHVLAEYGTLGPAEVLAPAVHYAEQGYPLLPAIVDTISQVSGLFRKEWTTSADLWLDNGAVPAPGTFHKNPLLAATYRRVIKEAEAAGGGRDKQIEAARKCWSQGFIAEAIDRFVRTPAIDTSGERHAGLITGDDLARWRAGEEPPVTFDYAGYTVAKCGPWTQGPVFLQQLSLLAGFDIAAMDPLGPDFVHTVVECAKLAFADREAYYGDPKFVSVPLETLLGKAYAEERRKLVGETASMEDRPGAVPGIAIVPTPDTRPPADMNSIAMPAVAGDGMVRRDTVHLDVADRHGNMIAATPSGGWLPSSPAIPGLGFALGTRAQMFWLQEGHPSALAPGKRPRATLTPSLALKAGKPSLAFGTPGGDQQDQWTLLFFLHHVHHGMNLQESIDAPAFHTDHFRGSFYPRMARPGSVTMEGRFPKATIDELRKRGHLVEVNGDWTLSRVTAVSYSGGIIRAGANPRGMQGYAVGR